MLPAGLLGVILEEATGTSLPQYADRVLLGPLGISERAWEPLLEGHVNGGAGLDLRPRDLARLGQLFLQQGWSGTRSIVPAEWVAEATEPRFADLGGAGPIGTLSYGYLWWIDVENDAFMARGHGGQLVYVVPSLDLVVVGVAGGQHENRRPVVGIAQCGEHLPAVHARHHPVQDNHVVLVFGGIPEAVDTIVRDVDSTSFGLEPEPEPIGEAHFVVDHQNAHGPSMRGDC